jgi:hypothetical protein
MVFLLATLVRYWQPSFLTKKIITMKKQYGFFYLLVALAIVFTSCRKDDRQAELNTDTSAIYFNKFENTKFFTIVNTGNSSLDYRVSSPNDFINVFPTSGLLGFNETATIEVNVDRGLLDFGLTLGDIWINSNGGTRNIAVEVFKPIPDPPVLWWDIDYLKIEAFENNDYITIANFGEQALEFNLSTAAPWISFSQSSGTLLSNQELRIWVNADRGGLSPGLYSSLVNINSNGGSAQIPVEMEVDVYSVTFFNPTYTPIEIEVPGVIPQEIEVLGRINFIFPSNPGSISYFASTEGETVNGQVLGLTLIWEETINLSNELYPIYDLNISNFFFFMSVKNYGTSSLDLWSINYDTEFRIDEDVLIPNDGFEYNFGYYDALDNTTIYARIVGTQFDAVWENGIEFNFPWTINQAILLESDQKKAGNIKSVRNFQKTAETQSAIKVTPRTQSKIRIRDSRSLINKR